MRRLVLDADVRLEVKPIAERLPPATLEALRAAFDAAAGIEAGYLAEYRAASRAPERGLLVAAQASAGHPVDEAMRALIAQIEARLSRTDTMTLLPLESGAEIARTLEAAGTRVFTRASSPARQRTASEEAMRALSIEHTLVSVDKQQRFWEHVGQKSAECSLDLGQGTLTFKTGGLFGKKHVFRCQLLAVEDASGTSWRWGWAAPGVPAAVQRAAAALEARGEREGLPIFTLPEVTLDSIEDAMEIAYVAVGMLRAHFYYRLPVEEGALWLVVSDPAYAMPELPALARFVGVVREALAQIWLPEHRGPLASWARWLGLRVTLAPGGSLRVEGDEGSATVRFDALGLVADLVVHVPGAGPPS